MKRSRLLVILSLAILSLNACTEKGMDDLPVPPSGLLSDSTKISAGRLLFDAHCAECHGSIAEGRTQRAARLNPPPPDFHERRYRKLSPGYLYRRIELGRTMEPFSSSGSVMPAWKPHLKERQIWMLVAYIRHRAGSDGLP